MYRRCFKRVKKQPEEETNFQMCCVTYRHHLALGGHEGRAVAQAELGLQGVEVDLQLALLLNAWRLVDASVVAEILQLLLHGAHGLLRRAVLQPRDGATDPLQQLQRDGAVSGRWKREHN